MLSGLQRLHPFQTADAQRLALLFGFVYFSQGMWYLPNQTITIVFKDLGFSAGQVATFFTISTVPWLIKPVYGLLSDFVPLFGRRRKSYFLLMSALAVSAGLALGLMTERPYWWLAGLFTVMGLGLAFTDVLTDALMVENGKALGRCVGRMVLERLQIQLAAQTGIRVSESDVDRAFETVAKRNNLSAFTFTSECNLCITFSPRHY